MTGIVLDTLAAHARERAEERRRKLPLVESKWRLGGREVLNGFLSGTTLREPGLSVIAEAKKTSPSKGVIAEHFSYFEIVEVYEAAKASCTSVLTEPKWFLGDDRYLREIAATVSPSCTRKDPTVDPYLIYKMWELGTSAVFLIYALPGRSESEEHLGIVEELGLPVLVGAHDEEEVGRAVEIGAYLIGVSNRDLKSFSVNMKNNFRLRAAAPDNCIFIAESGVRIPADAWVLWAVDADGTLVGEALMCAKNKAELLQILRKGYKRT